MDLNADGNVDILSGSYSRMGLSMAGLFQVLWGEENGEFRTAEALNGSDGEPLIIPAGDDVERNGGVSLETICTRPTAVDWDGDGDLDLVVGNFGGSFYVFVGTGEGVFEPTPQPLLSSDGQPLKIAGQHSDPFVIDWDGDGDLDLLSGSSQGGVQWAENVADAGELPKFDAFESLLPAVGHVELGELLTASDLEGPKASTRIWVDDVNGDGKLDLLVGDSVTLTSPVAGLSVAEYEQRLAEWQEKITAVSARYSELLQADTTEEAAEEEVDGEQASESAGLGGWLGSLFGIGGGAAELSPLEQAQEEMNQLYQQREEFMDAEMTGFVWLYLQK